MANTIYLVRHGEKERHPGDPGLTSRGLEQAKATGIFFKNKRIGHLYSSPYLRTRQTAQAIADSINKSVFIDDRLKERLNWGERDNESFAQFWDEWQKTDLNRDYIPQNGRSSNDVGRDVKSFLTEVLDTNNQAVVLVTHGGTIGDFLRAIFSGNALPLVCNTESGASYIEVHECSINILENDNNRYVLKAINTTDHLSLVTA